MRSVALSVGNYVLYRSAAESHTFPSLQGFHFSVVSTVLDGF